MNRTLVAATRGSLLASTQTAQTLATVAVATGAAFTTRVYRTTGDAVTDRPLASFAGTGVFVKELEKALLDGEADLAVHSLKDVPTDQPEGLVLAAFLRREDAADLLIRPGGGGLAALPAGALVGTGSPRRVLQLGMRRPDLRFADLRGNIDTRLRRLEEGAYDAIVLAAAGLNRLGRSAPPGSRLDPEEMLPAPGQGIIVLECRAADRGLRELLARVDDADARHAAIAERAFMERLEGGCKIPLAAHGRVRGGALELGALVGDPATRRAARVAGACAPADGGDLGRRLADRLVDDCRAQGIPLPGRT